MNMAPKTRARQSGSTGESEDDEQPIENTTNVEGSLSQVPGEPQGTSNAGASRRPNKAAPTVGKLSFTVKQAADHERIFDGQVVEDAKGVGSDRDGSYSLEDPDLETFDNDPTNTATGRRVTPLLLSDQYSTNRPNLAPNKEPSFTSAFLFGEGYVPISDFQPHAAFSSIRGSSSGSKNPAQMGDSWR